MSTAETYTEIHTEEEVFGPYCPQHAAEELAAMENQDFTAEILEYAGGYSLPLPELDAPAHCTHNDATGNCFALLDTRLTDDGLDYVAREIVAALSSGEAIGLDEDSAVYAWHEHFGAEVLEYLKSDVDAMLDTDAVYSAYVTAQLWTGIISWMTNTGEFGGEAIMSDGVLDNYASESDISAEDIATMKADVAAFIEMVEPYLGYWPSCADITPAQLGHDFSLTRNHHGTGFWDRGLGDLGDWLTRCAQTFGESSLRGYIVLNPVGHCTDCADYEWDLDSVLPETLTVYLEG